MSMTIEAAAIFPQWPQLPTEVQACVASHLGPQTMKSLAETCREGATLVRDKRTWRPLSYSLGLHPFSLANPKTFVQEKFTFLKKLKKDPAIKPLWEEVQHLPEEKRIAAFFEKKKVQDYTTIATKLGYTPTEATNDQEALADIEKWLGKEETQEALKQQKELDLRSCHLTFLPPFIGDLVNLESLDLFNNYLQSIPKELGKLSKLKNLLIVANELGKVPPPIQKLENLTTLVLSGNQIQNIPQWLTQLTGLKSLGLACNLIDVLPKDLSGLKNLHALDVSCNRIKEIPASIQHLRKLETLCTATNYLEDLPESLGNLWRLKRLFLDFNRFAMLPEALFPLGDKDVALIGTGLQIDFAEKLILGDGVPREINKGVQILRQEVYPSLDQNADGFLFPFAYRPMLARNCYALKDIDWCKRQAKLGDERAQETLGVLYNDKNWAELPYNKDKAKKWSKRGAKQGRPVACFELGNHYRDQGNDAKAIKWYRRSAQQGNANAKIWLSTLLRENSDLRRDEDPTDLALYLSGGSRANPGNLGVFLHEAGRRQEAVKWLLKGAKEGHDTCMEILGCYCWEGTLGFKSPDEAEEWFKKAAKKGRSQSRYNLGLVLYARREYDGAYKNLLKAAKAGHKFAQNDVAYLLTIGLGTAQDLNVAYEWRKKSAEAGVGSSYEWLSEFSLRGVATAKDPDAALDYRKKAGTPNATVIMAFYRLLGKLPEPTPKEAIEMLEEKYKEGEVDAACALARAYFMGLSIQPDLEKALYWFRKLYSATSSLAGLYGLKLLQGQLDDAPPITDQQWQDAVDKAKPKELLRLAEKLIQGVEYPKNVDEGRQLFQAALDKAQLPKHAPAFKRALFELEVSLQDPEYDRLDARGVAIFSSWAQQIKDLFE